MRKHNFIIPLLILVFGFTTTFSQSDTLELPFVEDWSSGSFETNAWQATGDGWLINNNVGDPLPSAELRTEMISSDSSYVSILTSSPIDASNFIAGDVFLDLNIRIINQFETGTEKLFVEVSGDTIDQWIQIGQFHNVWDIDFDEGFNHFNISNQAMGNTFSVRFKITGTNPQDVESWFIDNIHIYRSCAPPTNLEGEYFYENENWGAEVCWRAPTIPNRCGFGIYWDNEVYVGGVGLTDGGTFTVAQRWDAGQLKNWHGEDLTGEALGHMLIILNDDGFDDLFLKIWSGPNADSLIYIQEVVNPLIGDYLIIDFDEPVYFDTDEELWIGYTLTDQEAGSFPAGYDEGPAITGYGDMISTDGGGSWVPISDLNIGNNWIIHGYFHHEPNYPDISHFNIYRQEIGVDDDYILYDEEEYVGGQVVYCYQDLVPDVNAGQTYSYKVTSNWFKENDTCESDPALTIQMLEDFVTILVTDIVNQQSINISYFPNPFSTSTTISYDLKQPSTVQLTIFNHYGQQVDFIQENQSQGQHEITWDASGLPAGMYYFRLEAGEQIATGKLFLVR